MNATAIAILAVPVLCVGVFIIVVVIWASQTIVVQTRKQHAWSEFAEMIHGEYKTRSAGVTETITAKYHDWTMVVDTNISTEKNIAVDCTRVRAFFAVKTPFELIIHSRISESAAYAVRNPSEVTVLNLNSQYRVITSHPKTLLSFLTLPVIVGIHEVGNLQALSIRRRRNWHNSGVSNSIYEVQVETRGLATDKELLLAMYKLVTLSLDRLIEIDCAYRSFADGGKFMTVE